LELQGGGFDHGCLRLNSTDFLTRIPIILWIVLLVGAVLTVLFTYFFRLGFTVQLAMTGMVAPLIALNLYLVILFGNGILTFRVEPGLG
jgi:hypothetical protein